MFLVSWSWSWSWRNWKWSFRPAVSLLLHWWCTL